jgi:hypothetical protein
MCLPKLFQAAIYLPLRHAIYIIFWFAFDLKLYLSLLKTQMSFIFYLLSGFAIMLGARIWQQKFIEQLSSEHKAVLHQLFGKRSNNNLYISLATMVVFIVIVLFDLISIRLAMLGFALSNVLALAIPMNINYNKLLKANFPAEFTNNYLITAAMRIIGTIVIFSYLFFEQN